MVSICITCLKHEGLGSAIGSISGYYDVASDILDKLIEWVNMNTLFQVLLSQKSIRKLHARFCMHFNIILTIMCVCWKTNQKTAMKLMLCKISNYT